MGLFDFLFRKSTTNTPTTTINKPGALDCSDIIQSLRKNYGIDIKSVQKLNKILEKMGIQERVNNRWKVTKAGEEFSPFNQDVIRPNIWRQGIVSKIADYINKNGS